MDKANLMFMLISLASAIQLVDSTLKLHVDTDEPAILGTSVTFYARLENPQREDYQITFTENGGEERTKKDTLSKENGFTSNYTIPYGTHEKYGTYAMVTVVAYEVLFLYITVATRITYYQITTHFEGHLLANQAGRNPKLVDPTFVTTTNETELQVKVHDPTSYLNQAVNTTYSWYQNNTFIVNTTSPILKRNFTREGIYPIQANLTAVYLNSTATNTTNATYVEKYGSFNLNVTARIPVLNFTYSGTTWFRHGKLLELKVSCDGSPNYNYCWMIKTGPYNHTGNETCNSPTETNDCEFNIMRYFQDPGIYTLLIIIGNDVSHFVNQSTVNIYKVNRKPQFSVIIVPISCTIIAIVLVIFGFAYYWENRARNIVETADFDFGQSDEERPYTRFVDRLRESFYNRSGDRNLLINPDDSSVFTSS